ncbi:hypothetical protein BGX26_004231 [Mortierella sp. AD094]|nr:hypothetical protein BGX26_004231 [Mortierella sp. AD094]
MLGNFSSSCKSIKLDDGHTLQAFCRRDDDVWVWSRIDLNECLSNNNGTLKWGGAGFFEYDQEIRVIDEGKTLMANVSTVDRGRVFAYIALDERIANVNGVLTFICLEVMH